MFIDISGKKVFYRLDNGAIERRMGDGAYEKITGDNVLVRNFKVELMGNKKGDGNFPRITISVSVSPESDISYLKNIYTNVQATISSRSLDT
jgi:hypothetical protein